MNLYAYAGSNPISFSDPFGLDSVQVGCRKVSNTAGLGNHCAVRVFDADDNARIGELLNQGDSNAVVVFGGNDFRADKYKWTTLATPTDVTDVQFSQAVMASFDKVANSFRGSSYNPHGLANSNQFIHQVVKSAGGSIPASVLRFGVTPGICGGTSGMSGYLRSGSQCVR